MDLPLIGFILGLAGFVLALISLGLVGRAHYNEVVVPRRRHRAVVEAWDMAMERHRAEYAAIKPRRLPVTVPADD